MAGIGHNQGPPLYLPFNAVAVAKIKRSLSEAKRPEKIERLRARLARFDPIDLVIHPYGDPSRSQAVRPSKN